MNPRPTDCDADALITTPSRRLIQSPFEFFLHVTQDIYLYQCEVQMASSTIKMKSKALCPAGIMIKGVKHKLTPLNIIENLWSNVKLGLDF